MKWLVTFVLIGLWIFIPAGNVVKFKPSDFGASVYAATTVMVGVWLIFLWL